MTTGGETATPQIVPALIWRQVDDNMVVVSPESGDVHVLSQTAADIWRLLAEENDVSTIESYLVEHYVVSAEQAHDDVGAFIQELKSLGLLQ